MVKLSFNPKVRWDVREARRDYVIIVLETFMAPPVEDFTRQ